jgi:hypothetical protein
MIIIDFFLNKTNDQMLHKKVNGINKLKTGGGIY